MPFEPGSEPVPGPGLVVCRGCCCGTQRTRPGVDHDGQLRALRELAGSTGAAVVTSDCLGPCAQADVLVVRPSPAGRRAGGRPVWFGLLDDYAIGLLRAWVRAGGPGLAPVPEALELQRFARPVREVG